MSEPLTPSGPDLAAGVPSATIPDGGSLLGTFEGEAVLLARHADEFFAIGATCSHYGGPLAEGLIVGDTVRCPWHHACFSLRSGEALRAPALLPVACYQVERRGDRVVVTSKNAAPRSVVRQATLPAAPASVGIIGAGAAGNSCAEELRRLGYSGPVTCFDSDTGAPYDRPNLSKDYLAGNAPEEWIPLHPRAYYAERGIELRLGLRVTEFDAAAKRLVLEDGSVHSFGAIVLAPGAEPVRPSLPGAGPPVYTLRSLADSRAVIAAATQTAAKRVVILGASFIGLECAASLRTRGLEVTVVGPDERPLERILGREFGDFVRRTHEAHGVTFRLGHKAASLEPRKVVLDDGTRLDTDFVVAGIGVRPTTQLAAAAGLAVDDGIRVDAFLQTSLRGVFAAGDAVRYPDPRGGERRIEHWVHSQRMGQHVARNLVGLRAPFTDAPFFWSQHYDVTIAYVGYAKTWERVDIDGDLEKHDAVARYWANGTVRAVASIFRDQDSLRAEVAMERGEPLA
jgi:NADPH-dependent 2,4-dienoyl-CoA reductase/sulfur reductase-like enzyme/nitrite reductase/ring-hydroxylating ferredoxin subunit